MAVPRLQLSKEQLQSLEEARTSPFIALAWMLAERLSQVSPSRQKCKTRSFLKHTTDRLMYRRVAGGVIYCVAARFVFKAKSNRNEGSRQRMC